MDSCIICIGNRLLPGDAFGPAVFDYLQKVDIPQGIEIIEGGTAGLNLLPLVERRKRVVFVDTVSGFSDKGSLVFLDWRTVAQNQGDVFFGHDIGLAYVLAVLPGVCDGELPERLILVGLEGEGDDLLIAKAARVSLEIAAGYDPPVWRSIPLRHDNYLEDENER